MDNVKHIYFFSNGNTAVCDDKKQISKLQKPWILMFIKFLKSEGVTNLGDIEFNMPDGKKARYMEEHDNWSFD